jgi:hypothetical protein
MTEPDRADPEPKSPAPGGVVPAPGPAPAAGPAPASRTAPASKPAPRKRDLAETTGYVAGRTATGLTRMLLRSKTVRETLRNARDASREDD